MNRMGLLWAERMSMRAMRGTGATWSRFRCLSSGRGTGGEGRRGAGGEGRSGADEEFPTLDLLKSSSGRRFGGRKMRERKPVPGARCSKLGVGDGWGDVWPTARSFHPATVPLPLHQGYVPPHKPPPSKWGNLELMKIANFLHLTPPVIKRHCAALKRFCSPWPKELQDDQLLDQSHPLQIITNDYCHSLPTIRDVRARIVTLQIGVSHLQLDDQSKDKLFRLVGDRYNGETGILTIPVQNCPLKKQNYEYAKYLLTALYHESLSREKWEEEKEEWDMEKYVWEGSVSERKLDMIVGTARVDAQSTQQYKEALISLHNQGEEVSNLKEYGKSVRHLFNLPAQ